jgi:hypothetical protein
MAVLGDEKDWWIKQFSSIGLNVGAQAGQEEEIDVWFQATRNLSEGRDTHIDVDVVSNTDEYKELNYRDCQFWARKPELIVDL